MFAHRDNAVQLSEVIQMARNKVCTKTTDNEGRVNFAFTDGEAVTVDPRTLSVEIKDKLLSHGLSQKLGDSYAGVTSPTEARARVAQVVKGLAEGVWTTRTPGEPRTNMLVEALAELRNTTVDVMRDFVAALGKKEDGSIDEEKADEIKKSLRGHPEVKAKMSELKAKKDADAVAKAGAPSLDSILS